LLKYGGPDGRFLTLTMMKNHDSDGILATKLLGEKPCKKKKPSNDSKRSAPNAAAQTSSTTTILERPSAEAAASFLANK